jgi:hypothetical protein
MLALFKRYMMTSFLNKRLIWIVNFVKRLGSSTQKTTTGKDKSFQSIKVIYIKKGHLPGHEWYEQEFVHSYHHDQGGYAMAIKHDERKTEGR